MTTVVPAGPPAAFDPAQPLGEGVTVLEASAGTGKTHTVASLVVREVAAGRPLDEVLVVTFTRKATGTLRDRVWHRLAAAVAALDPAAPPPTDPLLAHLRAAPAPEVAERRGRLARALADFDGATIATTHGFCQQVLASLGVVGDAERDLEVVEDVGGLIDDAVDDLFVRRFAASGQVLFSRAVASRIAASVVANPDAAIADVDAESAEAKMRQRFAGTVRRRLKEQKRRGRLVTYDDLLARLADSLDDPVRGAMVAERLRRRFRVAVVDEFQDTDTVQWRILQAAFGSPPSRLVLVGDPKQAIYAFRGGDVHAYLDATRGAAHLGLYESWRADQPLLDGLDAFFAGAWLGGPDIAHHRLQARPGAEERRLLGAGAPLTVRIVERDQGRVARTPSGLAKKDSARAFVAADVAGEAVRLLTSGTTLIERDASGIPVGPEHPVSAGDLAVLVRRHRDAESVRDALHLLGVPAVVHGGAGVLATDAAAAWLVLLRALDQPSSTARVRAVAWGPFIGWSATDLATASDEAFESVADRLHDWAATLGARGVAALLHRIEATESLTARLLGLVDGERTLSDLRHVGELLQARPAMTPTSAAALAGWLAEQRAAGAEPATTRRRLGSDADAVAVHTIHGAKGLEFGVVLLPSLWEGPWTPDDEPPIFHDDQSRRCIGVGSSGPVHDAQVAAAGHERAEEELRLLYVAMTRARHRVVVWWATAGDAATSPFARVLLERDPASGAVKDRLHRAPREADVRRAIEALAEAVPGAIAVEAATGPGGGAGSGPAPTPAPVHPDDLGVSTFDRILDRRWMRTSYSGLTAAAHELAPGPAPEPVQEGEVEEPGTVDEPATAAAGGLDHLAVPVPLGDLPGGAQFGTLVHEILERTDFSAADLPGALAAAAAESGARRLLDGHTDAMVAGVTASLVTPLGAVFDGLRLSDLRPADRLDELAFDLPLAGGDVPNGLVTMEAIAGLFAATLVDDPVLGGYAERLRDPVLANEFRGFLTGSIDLVARVADRYVIVDYKTNRLAAPTEHLTAWHYRPEALALAMVEAHYPLQAALYGVALHRYLRWRLPAYDPSVHLGGTAYLFLRGMAGPDTPVVDGAPCGVFAWRPPVAFVTGLSDLLDRGAP